MIEINKSIYNLTEISCKSPVSYFSLAQIITCHVSNLYADTLFLIKFNLSIMRLLFWLTWVLIGWLRLLIIYC